MFPGHFRLVFSNQLLETFMPLYVCCLIITLRLSFFVESLLVRLSLQTESLPVSMKIVIIQSTFDSL